ETDQARFTGVDGWEGWTGRQAGCDPRRGLGLRDTGSDAEGGVMAILVLAERTDATADRVVHELNERDAVVFRCDAAEFPSTLVLSGHLNPGGAGWRGRLRTQHREVSLEDVTGVYFRRPTPFRLPEHMSAAERRFAGAEAKMGFGGVLMSLPCRWVN